MADNDIEAFAHDLVVDVLAAAEAEQTTTPEAFTRRVLEDLEQAGVVSNVFVAYHRSHGHEIHGYGINDAGDALDLYLTDFHQSLPEDRLNKSTMEALFKRLITFARRCTSGLRQQIDESSDVYDMCLRVEKALTDVSLIRLFILSNRISATRPPTTWDFSGIPVTFEIWDLQRLYRHATSGTLGEPIVVTFDPPLPCLAVPSTEPDHSVVLAVVSGRLLTDLYSQHGARLLELNVRSYLQARGAVNQGIRRTLLNAPGRFLAYNNGISATASRVEFHHDEHKRILGVTRIEGLQIVNGGQTTASIFYAATRDKSDLSHVNVQMKLTAVSPGRLSEIVPKISEFSNTQNKVTLVDFSSNHEFHVAVERVTRSLWAPAIDGSGQETHWFYERARGQYTDGLAQARTPANQRTFRVLWPTRQKFTKADLAKYVHSWQQLPYLVSRGAQKNFVEFMLRLHEGPIVVDVAYCQAVIAMAILFKAVDRAAAVHGAGSYKSAVTTYTVARLSLGVGKQLDLDRIWREQRVSAATEEALHDLVPRVMDSVLDPRRGKHVGEWAKMVACWETVSGVAWTVPSGLVSELNDGSAMAARHGGEPDVTVFELARTPPEEWAALEAWAKETRNLEPWQRQLAAQVGRRLAIGEAINAAQAAQALHVRSEATRLGFTPSPLN